MNLRDALLLGRVSNLPTVWANMLAGMVLAGGLLAPAGLVLAGLAFTLFYLGGMYLNDAFDADIDAQERPERPIPAGRVSRQTVYVAGYVMLFTGLALLGYLALEGGTGLLPLWAGVGLAVAIVAYDAYHKSNPLSPLIMGLCRMLVYVAAGALVAAQLGPTLWLGAGACLAWLIGLTYVAKQENLGQVKNMWPLAFLAAPIIYGVFAASGAGWPAWALVVCLAIWALICLRFVVRRGPGDIPRAVVSLIAGISLLDAMLIAAVGQSMLAVVALAAFVLTLLLQRVVPGT